MLKAIMLVSLCIHLIPLYIYTSLQYLIVKNLYCALLSLLYIGFCDGCEKWHTGVLLLQRPTSVMEGGVYTTNTCLQAWKDILLSGMYTLIYMCITRY